jgi:hypothetical protein
LQLSLAQTCEVLALQQARRKNNSTENAKKKRGVGMM